MTPAPDRAVVLDALADRVERRSAGRPVRVAIDGPDAAGKTTLADELAGNLRGRGLTVIRASLDDVSLPAVQRHRRGRDSAEGYDADGFDPLALVAGLLAPLGPGGNRRSVTRTLDIATDTRIEDPARTAQDGMVVVVDGVFLGRPELAAHWDLRFFVRITPEETLRRALRRDVPRLGLPADVEARHRARYLPAQAAYLAADRPVETADAVIDNEDPDRPAFRPRDPDAWG